MTADIDPFVERNREHWSNGANFKPEWQDRAIVAASLIEPTAVVCDIGCGALQVLRPCLPDGCRYLPCDMKPWTEAVEVCDLNDGRFPLLSLDQSDTVVMLGVLEYMTNPADVFAGIAQHVSTVVFSYHTVELQPRRSRLWTSQLNKSDIAAITAAAGFSRLETLKFDGRQLIFRVSKQPPLAPLRPTPRWLMMLLQVFWPM